MHLLSVHHAYCDDDCDPIGILGKPLYVPFEAHCSWAASGGVQDTKVVIESRNGFWPALSQQTWSQPWNQQREGITQLTIHDAQHLQWTEWYESRETVEPAGGIGGDIHRSAKRKRFIVLSETGPRTAHLQPIEETFIDSTYAVRLDEEDDTSLAERQSALAQAQRETEEARGNFTAPAPPEPMPTCSVAEECQPLCW